jgi:hypothetical protein
MLAACYSAAIRDQVDAPSCIAVKFSTEDVYSGRLRTKASDVAFLWASSLTGANCDGNACAFDHWCMVHCPGLQRALTPERTHTWPKHIGPKANKTP